MKRLFILLTLLVAVAAEAGVCFYTLGIDVNCPNGLGE